MVFVLGRVWSAISVGILAFVSLANMSFLETGFNPLFLGLLALMVLAGVLKPHLGALLGGMAFCVTLFANEFYLTAILFIVATGAWWFFVGRKGDAQANLALLPFSVGAVGFNIITPLLIGSFLTVKESVITVAYAFFISLILAGFGTSSLMGWSILEFWNIGSLNVETNMVGMLTQASTWIALIGWLLSSAILSLFCKRQTRLFAGIGIAVALVVLLLAVLAGDWSQLGHQASWVASAQPLDIFTTFVRSDILFTILAGIIVLLGYITLGVPRRHVNEE